MVFWENRHFIKTSINWEKKTFLRTLNRQSYGILLNVDGFCSIFFYFQSKLFKEHYWKINQKVTGVDITDILSLLIRTKLQIRSIMTFLVINVKINVVQMIKKMQIFDLIFFFKLKRHILLYKYGIISIFGLSQIYTVLAYRTLP